MNTIKDTNGRDLVYAGHQEELESIHGRMV